MPSKKERGSNTIDINELREVFTDLKCFFDVQKELLCEIKNWKKAFSDLNESVKSLEKEIQVLKSKLSSVESSGPINTHHSNHFSNSYSSQSNSLSNPYQFNPSPIPLKEISHSRRSNAFASITQPIRKAKPYYSVDENFELLAEKARNCVIKNLPEEDTEEDTRKKDFELVHAILDKAKINTDIISKIERHPERRPGLKAYRRPLKIFTTSRENRDLIKKLIAVHCKDFLPLGCYVRDDLTPSQLNLNRRLRSCCISWNNEVGWKRFVVRNSEIIDKNLN